MKKILRIIQIVAVILALIEIVAFGLFLTFYIIDFNGITTIINTDAIGYIVIGVILFNLLALFTSLIIISYKNQKNFLRIEDVIGSEVNQLYNFGGIGFIIIDEEDRIIWTSELFENRDLHILSTLYYDWCPDLKEFTKNYKEDFEKTIHINDFYYRVKFLRNNRLFIFKDVTEYENALILFNHNSLAIGIIMIDNYTDLAANNEDINDIIPLIKTQIANYGKQHHIVLRGFKNDSFLALVRNEDLEEMEKEGFLILNAVRQIGVKEDIKTSLSIAFAHDYPSIYQINEMASNALSVAMSRGGDQVVVAQMNSELKYYGGKTVASENRNKVKVRNDANAILNYIESNKDGKIFILGHGDMDMDCLGSILGVKAICDYKKAKYAKMIYDPKMVEAKTRGAFISSFTRNEIESFVISPKDAYNECDNQSLLIICDVNNPSIMMHQKIIDKTDKIIVIDHHRQGNNFVEQSLLSIIDTSASSASELVAEIIKYGSSFPPIPVDARTATIMLSGIFLDTGYYKATSVGVRTFEASMTLKEYGADNTQANDFLKDEFEEYKTIRSIVSTLTTPYYGVVYCLGPNNDILDPATIAKACDECMALKGTVAAFVIGRIKENEIKISGRSNGSVNVQIIIEKLGGGGHFTSASATLKDMDISEVEKRFLEVLDNNLSSAQMKEEKGE